MTEQTTPYPKALKLYPTIRQSVLGSFDNCALLTRFEREYRGGWSHPWQARGQMFHRFAARALAEMYAQQEKSIEVTVALAILQEVLRQHDVDRECPHCGSNRIRRGVTKRGNRICLACKQLFETEVMSLPTSEVKDLYWVVKKWAHDNSFDIENLVDVEQRLHAKIDYPNPYGPAVTRELSGKLDCLMIEGEQAEHAVVPDWKDMWGMPPPSEVSEQGYFQQRFYGWLVMRNYRSVQGVTLREFYVRFSEPREATIWRYQLDDIEQEISAMVERFDRSIEEHLYIPSPGKHCTFCPTPQRCPIPADARESGAIENAEQAELAAATIVVAETTLEKRRRALQAWTRNHGPVPVKDAKGRRMMGFRPTSRTERPTFDQIEALERDLGRAPSAKEIKSLYKTKPGTRFEAFSPRPDLETEEDEALIASLQEAVSGAKAAA